MTFPSFDLLATVIAPNARNGGGFDTLAIGTSCGWVFVPSCFAPYLRAQTVVNAPPDTFLAPSTQVAIDTLPFRVFVRHHSPLNTPYRDIEYRIDDLPHLQAAGSSSEFGLWDKFLDNLPLAVG